MRTTVGDPCALCATIFTAVLIFCVPVRVHAQRVYPIGIVHPAAAGAVATQALRTDAVASYADAASKRRSALIGGVIGGVAGAVTCTAIATLLDDSADRRIRACPTDSLVILIAGGFAIGALVGWFVG